MTNRLVIFTLLALLAVVPASASTFLTITEVGASNTVFPFVNNGTTTLTLHAVAVPISYTILVPNSLGTTIRTTGFLSIDGTSTTAAVNGGSGNFSQTGFSGSAYICDTAAPGGCGPGAYVFAMIYGPTATESGNGAAGGYGDGNVSLLTEVQFFSPYLLFTPSLGDAFSISTSGGSPAWAIAGDNLLVTENSGGLVGTFSATATPTGAPEPATMALLGSALIGLGIIGRKRFAR